MLFGLTPHAVAFCNGEAACGRHLRTHPLFTLADQATVLASLGQDAIYQLLIVEYRNLLLRWQGIRRTRTDGLGHALQCFKHATSVCRGNLAVHLIALQVPAHLLLLHLEGDAGLAQLVSDLARDLRWDSEHELARFTGGLLSKQIHLLLRRAVTTTTTVAARLSENVGEYVSEEAGIVVGKPALQAWERTLQEATVQLDQLDARLRALDARQRRSAR